MRVVLDNNTIEVTCEHCKSVLAVSFRDLSYHDVGHSAGSFSTTCAACGQRCFVKQALIPRDWVSKLAPD